MIKQWTLFGERNSGTNYLGFLFDVNFPELQWTQDYGYKHWYIKGMEPRGLSNNTTDLECKKQLSEAEDTLFVFMVRNPYDWTKAMYKNQWNLRTEARSFKEFLYKPLMSVTDNGEFIEQANDIIDLRNQKNKHFWELRKHVEHFALVRLENLKEDVTKLAERFKLRKDIDFQDYREPKEYSFEIEDIDTIFNKLDNQVDIFYYV